MNIKTYLAVLITVIGSLVACEPKDPLLPSVDNNYVEVAFDGKSRVYTDADLEFADGQYEINAGEGKDNIYLVILGTDKGTFPFGDVLKSPSRISAGHYYLADKAYRTYFTCEADVTRGLQVTEGSVVVEELIKNKAIKGRFSGFLMTDNPEEDCPTKLVPISGSFHITK